jgi:hypothetical protein
VPASIQVATCTGLDRRDLYGVVYTTMDSRNGWKIELARELKDACFEFDADKVFA